MQALALLEIACLQEGERPAYTCTLTHAAGPSSTDIVREEDDSTGAADVVAEVVDHPAKHTTAAPHEQPPAPAPAPALGQALWMRSSVDTLQHKPSLILEEPPPPPAAAAGPPVHASSRWPDESLVQEPLVEDSLEVRLASTLAYHCHSLCLCCPPAASMFSH